MPGKEIKLIGKTLHADGYYTASIISTSSEAATSEASEESTASTSEVLSQTATSKRPHIKLWFRIDKGLIIGLEQREKLMREEEQAAAVAKEEIPTPGFVLVQESVEDVHTSMSSTFQSKLDATKRKMHDSYQQLANAKKQRRIQVIDPRDLPPPPQSSSKGKGSALAAARKKMIITTKRNNNTRNFFDRGGQPKLMKPATSIF